MHKKRVLQLLAAAIPVMGLFFFFMYRKMDDTTGTSPARNTASTTPRLLVFSKTNGYRHESIKDGIAALQRLAAEKHVLIECTEDASRFTDDNLSHYAAVIFLMTSGNDILNSEQKAAFERYIHAGGGYAGIHSASDTEYHWSWYGRLVGAFFKGHPHIQRATLHISDHHHPSTEELPATWSRTDEWYNFQSNPRDSVHVLMTIDETTYQGGTMGNDHPIAWYHDFEGGRAWYTALGHTAESYTEPMFLAHLWGGIAYAAHLAG